MGWALRAFDQNGDGHADLAVGIPDQNLSATSNVGAVLVLAGGSAGISAAGNTRWHQDTIGVREVIGVNDRFGRAL